MMIGNGEYNKTFCEERLDLKQDEKPALFQDKVKQTHSSDGNVKWGCCRVPGGLERKRISKSEYCIYTPEYTSPTYSQKITYFLKRFK
jgi:hypothetical protein